MSTMGPAFVINGPVPVPPKYRLLDAAYRVEEATNHWLNGGAVWPYPETGAYTFDPCAAGTDRIKAEAGVIPLPEFNAFTVYVTETCTNRSVGDWDYWESRALASLAAAESYAVEREFSQGIALSATGTPYLADANVTILAGGAALAPGVGLSYLEDALGQSQRRGMLHATPGTVTAWGREFVAMHEPAPKVKDSRLDNHAEQSDLVTPMGTKIAAGAGYWQAHPDSVGAPAAGTAWAWATGDVEYRRTEGELVPLGGSETRWMAVDRADNTITYRAESSFLVTWDTLLQAAVLIDWTT